MTDWLVSAVANFTFGRAHRSLRVSEEATLAPGPWLRRLPAAATSSSCAPLAGRRVATKKRGWCHTRRRGALGEGSLLHQLSAGRTIDTPVVLVQGAYIRCIGCVNPQLEIRVVGGRGVVIEVRMLATILYRDATPLRAGVLRVGLLLLLILRWQRLC